MSVYFIQRCRWQKINTIIQDLLLKSPSFTRLMEEYGHMEDKELETGGAGHVKRVDGLSQVANDAGQESKAIAQMQVEERQTGTVSWGIYGKYLDYAGGLFWAPVFIVILAATQAAQGVFCLRPFCEVVTINTVGNTLFLGFWTSQSISGFKQGQYMGLYAGLGMVCSQVCFRNPDGLQVLHNLCSLLLRTFSLREQPLGFFLNLRTKDH